MSADGILAVTASNWTVVKRGMAVSRPYQRRHRGNRGKRPNPPECLVDSGDHIGCIDRSGGVEDDLSIVAGLGREALGQDALGLLGLADAAEVVLEAGADRGGNGDYRDHSDGPTQEDRSSTVVTPRSRPAEPVDAVLAGCCGRVQVCSAGKSHLPKRR